MTCNWYFGEQVHSNVIKTNNVDVSVGTPLNNYVIENVFCDTSEKCDFFAYKAGAKQCVREGIPSIF